MGTFIAPSPRRVVLQTIKIDYRERLSSKCLQEIPQCSRILPEGSNIGKHVDVMQGTH